MNKHWEDYFELISTRRSIRKFLDKPVEPEKISRMLDAVRLSPSSSNSQPWHVVVVRDRHLIDNISKAAPVGSRFVISWLSGAPLVFVLTVSRRLTHRVAKTFGHSNLWLDAGIAGQQLVLAAQALGLGTCWIGWFDERRIQRLLDLPKSFTIVALLGCGYPAEKPIARSRKPLAEIYSLERFNSPDKLN